MGYAMMLKDKSGELSGYRRCDAEVCYMPAEQQSYEHIFRTVKINIDRMEVLNFDFIKDDERVYRKGILLKGILPEGFHKYNSVYIGNHQVVFTPYGDARIEDPESFEALDEGSILAGDFSPCSFGRDLNYIYFFDGSTDTRYAVRLRACHNLQSFTLLGSGYAKDDRHVFYKKWMLREAKVKTFAVLNGDYAKDHKSVFLGNRMFAADAQTFVALKDGYAKDCNHLYKNGFIVEDCV